jgi:hypothetical protein
MVKWTIFVLPTEEPNIIEVEIDNEKTFSEFRRIVSQKINVNSNDLIFTGSQEYNYTFNSKKLKDIDGIYDQITLYAVYQVGGGK